MDRYNVGLERHVYECPMYWTTILVQTCIYNHTVTSFVNSGRPYIPLEEGSYCALLPVGLRYILLLLVSLCHSVTVLSSILRCVFVDFTTPWAVAITVRKAWVSGESSPVVKDSLTNHPWFSWPGHTLMPRSFAII